jgi:hypothetical protein
MSIQREDILRAAATPLTGRKNDNGKVRLELVPPELLFAVGQVLTFGANKYADRNWEKACRGGACLAR